MDKVITDNPNANEVMVTIIDAHRALHDAMPVGIANYVLAALTAEPETLEELETAMTRYDRITAREGFVHRLHEGLNEEPWDSGVLIVDLPARLIVAETEPVLYDPKTSGYVVYRPDPEPDWDQLPQDEIVGVRFRLSGDWLLLRSLEGWRERSEQRRRERMANPPFDVRPILFGETLTAFIARECLAARDRGAEDPVVAIHERWLMTPREDLRGQTPRELLCARLDFVDWELESRASQWSFAGVCPDALDRDSTAFRCAGFGTHSIVTYFYLVRHLIDECWKLVGDDLLATSETTAARLEGLKNDWLAASFEFSYEPNRILEQERLRVPLAVSAHEAVIDPDCPMCQMALDPDLGGPTFWHLDGCNMVLEDNWIFSFHQTKEEWEAEQREWEERDRRIREDMAKGDPGYRRSWISDDIPIFGEDSDEEREGDEFASGKDDDVDNKLPF